MVWLLSEMFLRVVWSDMTVDEEEIEYYLVKYWQEQQQKATQVTTSNNKQQQLTCRKWKFLFCW